MVIIAAYIIGYTIRYSYDVRCDKMKVLPLSDTASTFYISERDYAGAMQHTVAPFVDSIGKTGSFTNGGHTIAYNMYLLDSPIASIVISHGFTERKEKYKEAIYYFLKMGYQVFIVDHYCHGNSSRYNSDSSLVYASDYQVFVDDITYLITNIEKPRSKGAKTILFGHSMGGGIAARTVEEHPDLVDGVILSAPLMKLSSQGAPPEFLSDPITKLMILAGKGADYALGQRAYDPALDKIYDTSNPSSYCIPRGQYWNDLKVELSRHPNNGSSWQLASDFLAMTHDAVSKKNVQNIKIPILLFQAEKDKWVDPKGHYEFADHAQNIEFYFMKGAGHEIYFEKDKIIVPYYNKLHEFIDHVARH